MAACHGVVTFDRNEEGDLVPGEGTQVPSMEAAGRSARMLAPLYAGVVAFSRTGDPATGEFSNANVDHIDQQDLDVLAAQKAHSFSHDPRR